MMIFSVAMSEHNTVKDAGLRQLKYEWSLPDFWKLKTMVEYKSKLTAARMEDHEEYLEELRRREPNS